MERARVIYGARCSLKGRRRGSNNTLMVWREERERESSWERNGLHLISSMLMAGKELNPLARLQSWKDMWSTFEKHTHAALDTCAAR